MAGRVYLIAGALAGVATALVVALAIVVAWPGTVTNVPPRPTAMILPAETPTPTPVSTPTPSGGLVAGPSGSIAPFGGD
jgi:hypothetical protein